MVIKGGCKQLMNVKEELSQLKKGKMWFTYSLLWFGKQLRCIIGCTGGDYKPQWYLIKRTIQFLIFMDKNSIDGKRRLYDI